MTIKEIVKFTGVNDRTIRKSIQKLFPNILTNGIQTILNEYQAGEVIKDLRIKELPNLGADAEVLTDIQKKEIILKGLQFALEQYEAVKEKYQLLIHSSKLYTATEIAKELNIKSAYEFNQILESKGIQYKVNETWVLCAQYADKEYTSIEQQELDNGKIIYDRKWTGRGRDFILNIFKVGAKETI